MEASLGCSWPVSVSPGALAHISLGQPSEAAPVYHTSGQPWSVLTAVIAILPWWHSCEAPWNTLFGSRQLAKVPLAQMYTSAQPLNWAPWNTRACTHFSVSSTARAPTVGRIPRPPLPTPTSASAHQSALEPPTHNQPESQAQHTQGMRCP